MRRLICAVAVLAAALAAQLGIAASAGAATAPQLSVTGASLTVASTGQQLYGYNADKQLLIASTTKMMTALVVLQRVQNLNELFTAPDWTAAAIDSQIGLRPGERMTVHDLMLALLLPSADDAAMDLAYNVGGGSVSRFVGWMNADAVKLGLTHTHYENPVGLDSSENYSSPYDLTRLAAYLLAHYPFVASAVKLTHATLESGNYVRSVTNTDTLLGAEPWITGVKTGHTNAAGYILVSSGTQDGLTLVASVLGTDSEASRDANALALMRYGFAQFHQVAPISTGTVMAHLPVYEQGLKGVVVTDGSWQTVLPRSDRVSVVLHLPKQLSGPLPAGHRVGEAEVVVNGHAAGQVPLQLEAAIPAVPALTKLAHFITRPATLGLLALLLALGVAATAVGLRRRRPKAMAGKA